MRGRLRRGSTFRPAGIPNLQGSSTFACSRELIGYHSHSSPHRRMNRDPKTPLPSGHFYAVHSALKYKDKDTRRPCSAPSITPGDLRYKEALRNAVTPPPKPRIRLFVPSRGSSSDPSAGRPGPRAAMNLRNGQGPSTPVNLKKMRGNFRCQQPFRREVLHRPESAPPQPGMNRCSVPPGYTGFKPGLTSSPGMSTSQMMLNTGAYKTVRPVMAWSTTRASKVA